MQDLCPRVEWTASRNPGFPRARYPCVCAAPVYRGTPIAKGPNSGGVRSLGGYLVVPTNEPFPFWQRFGISEPLQRRSLTPVNAFLGNVLETSRLDFLSHPLARERHSRANARRRIGHDPFAIRSRVKYDFSGATFANPDFKR